MHFRECGWIVVCGNTLVLTRLWQSCLATDKAENSVLQLLSGVENHLMLSMTQDSFSFFHPDPVPMLVPQLIVPPHKTGPSHSLSLGGSPPFPFLSDGPSADSAVFLWHYVPFCSHSPDPGRLVGLLRDETLSDTPDSLVMVF